MAPLALRERWRSTARVTSCEEGVSDAMETATPGVKSTADGWLNRYLHARQHEASTPFRAVALVPRLPRALQGRQPALAIGQIGQFGIRAGQAAAGVQASFEAEYTAATEGVLREGRLRQTGREAFEAVRMLKRADPGRHPPENGASYPRSAYGEALRQIAQLIKANVGLELAFAESMNWDHHVNEGSANGRIGMRLDDFARGIAALVRDLGRRMEDVVILTMSEFGRAAAENGSGGTDHGHGNAIVVIGGQVRGGRVYGRWPGLAPEQRYEGRDLSVTTDFRTVFVEVVREHLGLPDVGLVFPGFKGPGSVGVRG